MQNSSERIELTICMGSSCFSRGNNKMIHIVQDYIKAQGLERRVTLSGTLCEGRCRDGPGICINGVHYDRLTPATLRDILNDVLVYNSGE